MSKISGKFYKLCYNGNSTHLIQYNHIRCIFTSLSSSMKKRTSSDDIDLYLIKDGNKHIENSAVMAINDYDKAIEMHDNTPLASNAYANRSFAYFYIKDYDQALRDSNKSIELNPRNIDGYIACSSIYIALEDFNNALQHLQMAYDLTSPLDFRRNAINEVINGCKVQNKIDISLDNELNNDKSISQTNNIIDKIKMKEPIKTESKFEDNNDDTNENSNDSDSIDMPFSDSKFMDLQKDLTERMMDAGGEEFKQKLMKLNDIEAVRKFQTKALKGQKPVSIYIRVYMLYIHIFIPHNIYYINIISDIFRLYGINERSQIPKI